MSQSHQNRRRRSRGNRPRRRDAGFAETPEIPPTLGQKIKSFFTFGWLKKPTQSSAPVRGEGRRQRQETDSQPIKKPSRRREKPVFQKPDPADVTSERLYVGNLSYDATESDLFELFNGVGTTQHAEVVTNPRTHRSKGYAFIQMRSVEEARRAVEVLHDQEFMGRKMIVSAARPPSGKRGGEDYDQEEVD
jgi:RNA recognition motif-containing protein